MTCCQGRLEWTGVPGVAFPGSGLLRSSTKVVRRFARRKITIHITRRPIRGLPGTLGRIRCTIRLHGCYPLPREQRLGPFVMPQSNAQGS